jgi:hypothetical protein
LGLATAGISRSAKAFSVVGSADQLRRWALATALSRKYGSAPTGQQLENQTMKMEKAALLPVVSRRAISRSNRAADTRTESWFGTAVRLRSFVTPMLKEIGVTGKYCNLGIIPPIPFDTGSLPAYN